MCACYFYAIFQNKNFNRRHGEFAERGLQHLVQEAYHFKHKLAFFGIQPAKFIKQLAFHISGGSSGTFGNKRRYIALKDARNRFFKR